MPLNPSLRAALNDVLSSPVLSDAPLAAWTTFRIGGPADALVTPGDVNELQQVLVLCGAEGVAWKLLGRGSNILAADDGFRGVIIVLGEGFKDIARHDDPDTGKTIVRAGAALALSKLADWCAGEGLGGMEFTAGIPGTVGGAVVMNAGAWEREMGDVVVRLGLCTISGQQEFSRDQLHFGYRRTDFPGGAGIGSVVTEVELLLEKRATGLIQEEMKRLRRERGEKQPVGMPTAGSFFKNPVGFSAGKLLDEAGLKGFRVGDAEISEKHANFFVNRGRATAAEVIGLMHEAQKRVKDRFGITLEPEVQLL